MRCDRRAADRRPRWRQRSDHAWRRASSVGPRADRDLERDRFAGATRRDAYALAHAVGTKLTHEHREPFERALVEALDHVALANSGCSTRTVGVDAHHHRANGVASDSYRLQTDPEITARDLAMRIERCRDAVDRRRGNDQHASPRAEHRHADRAALGVEHERTLRGVTQRRLDFDSRVDRTAAQTLPRGARVRDEREGRNRIAAGAADHDRERTGVDRMRNERYR